MEPRLLGQRTGLRVSALALGTGRLGTDGQEVLSAFARAGGTFIDASSAYQAGESETQIGQWLRQVGREGFVIASKYGRTSSPNPAAASVGNHRVAMRAEVEASLRRLGTDRIDVYFAHFDDGVTPIDEIMRGFDELVRAGKIVHVGLSNFPAWRSASAAMLADLRGWAPLVALQLQYNLLQRDTEREHLPFAAALGLGVMAYSPLASGQLAKGGDAGVPMLLAQVARELSSTPIAVAIAWLHAKNVLPVIGPRTLAQLEDNLLEVTLPDDTVRQLDAANPLVRGYPYDQLDATRASAGLVFELSGRVL